jgi:dienelactone hydrolase
MDGFVEEHFKEGPITRSVFRKGHGFGVVLLHELPGLTTETVSLAEHIIANGFHVAMPLLFGQPLQRPATGLAMSPLLCLKKEFHCFSAGKSSAITPWLRALCRKIHGDCGGRGVGAIGMCFTGGFIISMMIDPSVAAPIAAQPTLPFFNDSALDAPAETIKQAAFRAEEAPLLALRFAEDSRCKRARFETLNHAFCGTRAGCHRFQEVVVPGKGHSTLTFDYESALARGQDTRRKVVEHLRLLLES